MKTIQDVKSEVHNFFEFVGSEGDSPRVSEPYDPYDPEHHARAVMGNDDPGIYVFADEDGRVTYIGAAYSQSLGKSLWSSKYFGAVRRRGQRIEYERVDEEKVPDGVQIYTIPLEKLENDERSRAHLILALKHYLVYRIDPKHNNVSRKAAK